MKKLSILGVLLLLLALGNDLKAQTKVKKSSVPVEPGNHITVQRESVVKSSNRSIPKSAVSGTLVNHYLQRQLRNPTKIPVHPTELLKHLAMPTDSKPHHFTLVVWSSNKQYPLTAI